MDINKIRQDFPLLSQSRNGQPLIFFDNACSALKPQPVIEAINDYYVNFPACGARSNYEIAELVNKKCREARKIIADFINAKNIEEIIFTRNTTEGINLIAHSFDFKPEDVVMISDKEHNSNLVPWQILVKQKGIKLHILKSRDDNTFDLDNFKKEINEKVKLVSLGWSSNLDGVSLPVADIVSVAHQFGAKILFDAAQAAPHHAIDVQKLDIDFLAFSGHKMLGPSGTGVLFGKKELLENLEPFLTGGDTVEYTTYDGHKLLPLPEKFEAGLQDYAGIIGLGVATRYLQNIGFEYIEQQELALNQFITEKIIDIKKLKIIGPADAKLRSGIINFTIDGLNPHETSLILDKNYNIMVRSGQHCVHSWYNSRGITNSIRASLYFYNTLEETQVFVEAINTIAKLA